VLWRQGVSAVAWLLVVDQPLPVYGWMPASGVYYVNGRAKPGLQAFRFPFVVEPASDGRKVIWGISPQTGTVLVQVRRGRRWQTFLRLHITAHGVFTATAVVPAHALLRAQVGRDPSLAWHVG
jgi:hypothetical protein